MTIYYAEADMDNPHARRSQPSAHKKSRRRGKGRKDHRHPRHPKSNDYNKHYPKKKHYQVKQKQPHEQGQKALGQTPFELKSFDPKTFDPKSIDLDSLDLKNLDVKNIDMKSLDVHKLGEKISGALSKSPLPVGLKFPKELTLEQLHNIIETFHKNETRTDIRAPLPMDFEADKSVFTFLYSINNFKDPTVNLPGCPVAGTPLSTEDSASGLIWQCEAGHFCAAPNVSVPCLPGFYCPANTAQPTLCCKGYVCSPDAKTIEACPAGFFCPAASTSALPCNFLAFCPRGTAAVEKYGLGAVFFAFALITMAVFSVKKRIFRAQRLRYRQRLRELGDNRDDLEDEKRQKKEAAQLAQSIILEDQKRNMSGSQIARDGSAAAAGGGGGGGLESGASHRSLALAAAAAGNMNVSTMSLPKAERQFDIRFDKLGLTLPTGVDIIKNISGRLLTGRTCAVMGPSGAGKTTFLSILAGKVAKTDGSIKVNGKEQTLSLWKKLIGFVPQEDVMLADLSVREILMHSARMRQPVHMSHNEKRLKVLEVIQFLGLGHIMDNPIGDVETRGVSGGERKRVNIGMELVASPSILFLDEPTSGLDSATSLEVCKLLKQIAQEQSLTVAAVVHSPSPHAFNQFDDLLLLGSGGRVVYSGPRDEAANYFESIGYPVPDDESPADFFIALAAGRVTKLPRALEYDSQEDDDAMTYGYPETIKPKTPRERTQELFGEWESHCRNKALSKTLEKHAIRESDTMITVRLSNDGSSQGSPDKRDTMKHVQLYPLDQPIGDSSEKSSYPAILPEERDCHVSTMALHQPSRPQSPTFSVPISNLAGSSNDTADQFDVIKNQGQGFWRTLRMSFITNWADSVSYIGDVFDEMGHWLWSIKCRFTGEKDPVRETPSFGNVFLLCFKRACLQNYRSQMGFLSDQSLHLACGLCVSFASKDMMYIPRQPAEICAMAPPAIQFSCATPLDDIPYVGMFMSLGVYFAGISVGSSTFGDEKAVYWRDTSAGMPTLPYYLAKILADVPRMIVAACMYTGAFIFFFAYRQQLSSLFLVILLLYINAFSLGYFVSAVVSRSMFGLAGTGMSLAWALVLSGTAPHLYKVINSSGYATVRWVWDISAPRWGVEAFYLKEMDSRIYNELKHNVLGDMYAFEHYEGAIMSMIYIGLGWNILTFTLMKLLNRHKVK
ncbi:hypothetical protein BGZ95_000312 [Linnemannia exigua]|uniref:ABC transporter domain-containing protein n=1 Tax=Linnemannia exigua TaxID=604196 RepID=A0AAD4H4V4_9FUNG|nr:hypothetical protein BGZ95_000312 [Linnemannia exigua]